MNIDEYNLEYFIAFGMGFVDSTAFKNKINVFKIDDNDNVEELKLKADYYEYGYETGKQLMDETIQDITKLN